MVFMNGGVYTVERNRPWAEAVAINDGLIVYVGDNTGALDYLGATTERVDLEDRMLLPGFHDSHMHPMTAGTRFLRCQLMGQEWPAEALAQLRECARDLEPGDRCVISGCDRNLGVPFERSGRDIDACLWTLVRGLHGHFIHSNIKTNLGPLRYVIISPQAHRVHHSIEEKHYDKNFGVTFSIWDQLFNTFYRKYDEYPEAQGVADTEFPIEHNTGWRSFVLVPIRQLIYPFRFVKLPGISTSRDR